MRFVLIYYIMMFKTPFFLTFFFLCSFDDHSISNPINELNFKNKNGLYNFFVEIPAGTKQKWEVDKQSGLLEWEKKKGKKRIINFLSYPGNYGFIPQTLSYDGDPIDVIDLDENIERGSVKEIKIIGGLYFEDKKKEDVKIIGVDPNGSFGNIKTMKDLSLNKFSLLEILKMWFESYKKPGKMIFYKFLDKDQSIEIIEESHERWLLSKNKK